jgi:Zn ribbon nucleic-acid-binding protein
MGQALSVFRYSNQIQKEQEKRVMEYFHYCPFCYAKDSMSFNWDIGNITMYCKECGAKWSLHWSILRHGFVGAKLVNPDVEGKGKSLLKDEHPPDFWKSMGLSGHRIQVPPPPMTPTSTAKEKEIITKKEVIIKIRCPYCKNLYDETLDKCPRCGGKS